MSRGRLRGIHILGAFLATLAGAVLLGAVAVGLFRFAAAATPHSRRLVERWSAEHLGLRLRLASINLLWRRLHPEFVLTGVRLLGPDHHPAVDARRLALGLSWSGLLHARLAPAWVELDGLTLPVVEGARGRWRLPRALAPLLAATSARGPLRPFEGEVRLRRARFLLRAPALGARPLVLDVRRFHLVSHEHRARLRLEGRFPGWGADRFVVDYDGRGSAPWRPWRPGTRWRLGWRLSDLHAGKFLLALGPRGASLAPHGRLASRGTLAGRGLVFDGHAGLAVTGFRWKTPRGRTPPLAVRFGANVRSAFGRTAIDVPDLAIRRAHAAAPLPVSLAILLHPTGTGTEIRVSAPLVTLETLRLPLEALRAFFPSRGWTARLGRLDPHGSLVRLRVRAWTADGRLAAWTLRGYLLGLRTRRAGGLPGLIAPPLRLALGSAGGGIDVARGAIDFRDSRWWKGLRSVTTGGIVVGYRHTPAGWTVAVPPFQARLAAGRVRVALAVRIPRTGSPDVRLALAAKRLSLPAFRRALPTRLFGRGFDRWLAHAFPRGGRLEDVRLDWAGPAAGVPYVHGGGILRIAARARLPRLVFAPGWPAVDNASLALLCRDGRFTAVLRRGTFAGWRPPAARFATGPGFHEGRLALRLEGGGAAVLAALRRTPLLPPRSLPGRLHVRTGTVDGRLAVTIPFARSALTTVAGRLGLSDVTVGTRSPFATLAGLRGVITLTPQGFSTKGLEGSWLGAPFAVTAAPSAHGVRLAARGEIPAAALARALGRPTLSWLTGRASWTLDGTVGTAGGTSLVWRSTLRGLGIGLGAPFAKPAPSPRLLSLVLRTGRGGVRLRGRYAGLLHLYLELPRGKAAAVGALSFGPGRPVLPDAGLALEGELPAFDLRDLVRLLGLVPAGRAPASAARGPVVRVSALRIGKVRGYGQDFGPLTLTGTLAARDVSLSLSSAAVAGHVLYRRDPAHPSGLVRLDFARLDLAVPRRGHGRPSSGRRPVSPAPRRTASLPRPGGYPALVLRSLSTRLGAADLGRVEARFAPAPHAWILDDLRAKGPGYTLSARGYWARHAGTDHVRFALTFTSRDVHTAFLAFGFTPLMTGRSAVVHANLGWHGVPWRIDRPSLSGVLSLVAHDGRVLAINPGAARLLGLLSLSSLPRRLGLDFSDVFDRGLSYSTIAGRFTIRRGVAVTPSLTLVGPDVHLRLEGRADIVDETYDQVVRVVPLVSSSLPLAGAAVGGPVGFAVLLVVSRVLSLPLRKMLATYYHIGGTWSKPVVRRISDDEAHRLGYRAPPSS